jgi:hypothetical protein
VQQVVIKEVLVVAPVRVLEQFFTALVLVTNVILNIRRVVLAVTMVFLVTLNTKVENIATVNQLVAKLVRRDPLVLVRVAVLVSTNQVIHGLEHLVMHVHRVGKVQVQVEVLVRFVRLVNIKRQLEAVVVKIAPLVNIKIKTHKQGVKVGWNVFVFVHLLNVWLFFSNVGSSNPLFLPHSLFLPLFNPFTSRSLLTKQTAVPVAIKIPRVDLPAQLVPLVNIKIKVGKLAVKVVQPVNIPIKVDNLAVKVVPPVNTKDLHPMVVAHIALLVNG